MNTETTQQQQETLTDPASHRPAQAEQEQDSEFQLTVRKLELPVRPRGVLAE